MSRRTIISSAASVIIGIACIAAISTDALAYRGGVGRVGVGRAGVYHGGVHRGGVYRGAAVRRGVAVGRRCCRRSLRLLQHAALRIPALPTLLLELSQGPVSKKNGRQQTLTVRGLTFGRCGAS